jgi:hypothetical protein
MDQRGSDFLAWNTWDRSGTAVLTFLLTLHGLEDTCAACEETEAQLPPYDVASQKRVDLNFPPPSLRSLGFPGKASVYP